ncbi:hypothetical protein ICE98_00362 [Lactococcus lactis]|nr:hypothetical protein [Lactococcus lactis]
MSVSILTASPFLCVSLFVISEAKVLEILQMLATMLQRDSTSMDVNVMPLVSESGYVIDYTITPASWLIVQ